MKKISYGEWHTKKMALLSRTIKELKTRHPHAESILLLLLGDYDKISEEYLGIRVGEAGKRGGRVASLTLGHEFYEEIGRKGGQKVKALIAAGKKAMKGK